MRIERQIGEALSHRWLTGLVALLLPTIANAAWLGYKNNTAVPVVIQSAVVVNNQLRWGKPHTLFPGEVAWDAVTTPGARVTATAFAVGFESLAAFTRAFERLLGESPKAYRDRARAAQSTSTDRGAPAPRSGQRTTARSRTR